MLDRMKWLMEGEGGGAGGGAADWRAVLPETMRADPALKDFKDVGALAQSFIETKSLVGKSIRPPGPEAKPEDKKAFVDRLLQIEPALVYAPDGDPAAVERMWKRLGLPSKPEEYEVPEDATKAGLDVNDLRALAAKTKLTKGQFRDLVATMSAATLEQKRLAALDKVALEQEWGEAKEERTLAAHAAAMKMGLDESEVKALTPKQLRAFFAVAKAVGVNRSEFRRQADGGGGAEPLAPGEAQRQMDEIRGNPHYFDAYTNPSEHRRLVSRMSELAAMAYPQR